MTIGSGRRSSIRRAASIPSRSGIFTSITARSGSCRAASSTASPPSRASATTSNPARSSIARMSSRMIVSSSAIRTRPEIAPPPFLAARAARAAPRGSAPGRSSAPSRRCAQGGARGPRRRPSAPRWGRRGAAHLDRPLPCSTALANSSQKTSASAFALARRASPAPASWGPGDRRARGPASPPAARSGPRSRRRPRGSVSSSWTAAIERIRLTLSCRARCAGSSSTDRACRRSSDATVWRLFLTRWWISAPPATPARTPSAAALVQLRVLDRLADLASDRRQQLDLVLGEHPRPPRAHVERPLQPVAGHHRHGQDRLVLVLGQVGKRDEAGVQVGGGGEHDRPALDAAVPVIPSPSRIRGRWPGRRTGRRGSPAARARRAPRRRGRRSRRRCPSPRRPWTRSARTRPGRATS